MFRATLRMSKYLAMNRGDRLKLEYDKFGIIARISILIPRNFSDGKKLKIISLNFNFIINFSDFAPFLEICRSLGVITYYSILQDDLSPNRIILETIFGFSAIVWSMISLRRDLRKLCRKMGVKIANMKYHLATTGWPIFNICTP